MDDLYQIIDYRRFRPYVVGNARLEVLHTGMTVANLTFGGPKRNRGGAGGAEAVRLTGQIEGESVPWTD